MYTIMYLLYMAYVGHGGIFGKQLLGYSPNPHLRFDICSTEQTLRMLFLGNAFCSERCTLHKQISSIRGHVAYRYCYIFSVPPVTNMFYTYMHNMYTSRIFWNLIYTSCICIYLYLYTIIHILFKRIW